jgi:hypothetical protein
MAHHNTVFHQMVKFIPRHGFNQAIRRYGGDYRVRSFDCWSHFLCLLYAQLTRQVSLRELEVALRSKFRRLYHLGVSHVRRSTLADANHRRAPRIFEETFGILYKQCLARAPHHRFSFKNPLYTLDSTTIGLCLSLFRWAKFRKRKGAVKIHTLLDHRGQIPSCVIMTDGKTHDIVAARRMRLEPDSILIVDRAYIDFCWLYQLHLQEVWFVTRLKSSIKYRIVRRNKAHRAAGITSDHIIRIEGSKADCIPINLRRVRYVDPETKKAYLYLTDIFHLDASEIAAIYKERWQVELFFRWIKQHLKIKSFLGTSPNAVMNQIWVALCAYLLLAYLKFLSRSSFSMYTLKKRFEVNLLDRIPMSQVLLSGDHGNLADIAKQQLCFAGFG